MKTIKKWLPLILGVIIGIVITFIVWTIGFVELLEDWVGFYEAIVASIIGGLFTWIALYFTIKVERNNTNYTIRLSVIPYFKYSVKVLDYNVDNNKKYPFAPQLYSDTLKNDDKEYMYFYIELDIKNIVDNIATKFTVLDWCIDNVEGARYRPHIEYGVDKDNSIKYYFLCRINKAQRINNSKTATRQIIKIRVGYTDILDSYYEQQIVITNDEKFLPNGKSTIDSYISSQEAYKYKDNTSFFDEVNSVMPFTITMRIE